MKAILALEDGTVHHGEGFGARAAGCGEVCFNTSMTGYQEILTDPSYKGQIVTMTYPLIGNYGVNRQDVESWRPHVAGFVIRELSPVVSNWRADYSLAEFLEKHGIPLHPELIEKAKKTSAVHQQPDYGEPKDVPVVAGDDPRSAALPGVNPRSAALHGVKE